MNSDEKKLDLEQIQANYLEDFPNNKPFLYKIEFAVNTIGEGSYYARQLKALGALVGIDSM